MASRVGGETRGVDGELAGGLRAVGFLGVGLANDCAPAVLNSLLLEQFEPLVDAAQVVFILLYVAGVG